MRRALWQIGGGVVAEQDEPRDPLRQLHPHLRGDDCAHGETDRDQWPVRLAECAGSHVTYAGVQAEIGVANRFSRAQCFDDQSVLTAPQPAVAHVSRQQDD